MGKVESGGYVTVEYVRTLSDVENEGYLTV